LCADIATARRLAFNRSVLQRLLDVSRHPGFATDFNLFIEHHQIDARPLSRNLILATMVPVIGILFYWGLIAAICNSINSVRQSRDLEIDIKV